MKSVRNLFILLALSLGTVMPAPAIAFQESEAGDTVDDQTIEDALEAIRAGDFKTGRAILEFLSEQANPEAMYHLAEMARLGIDGEVSMPIAIMFYRLSSRLGNAKSGMKLANILYFDGGQTPAEIAEALAIWQAQAISGNAEAAYVLGLIYWNGEDGRTPDPVRGYGLVWKAAEAGYKDAVNSELEMRTLLPGDAREAAQVYAQRLPEFGFSDEHLNLDMLVEGWTPDEEEEETVEKPGDWSTVWHLEVGFAMREDDAQRILGEINEQYADTVKGLFSEMVPSPNRLNRYKLIFGPLDGLHAAVSKCVDLKRGGYDCFAKPPG